MKTTRTTLTLAAALTGLAAGVAHAGSTLELATIEYGRGAPVLGKVTVSTEEEALRLEIESISSNETGGLIFNGIDDTVMILDHAERQFVTIDREQVGLMAARVTEAMQQMQAELEKMPPEQRKFAEEMLQARLPQKQAEGPRGDLHATDETETIAGLECRNYDVMQGEHKFRDLCVVGWDAFPEGQEVAAAMLGLSKFFKEMREAFAESGGFDLMDRQQDMFSYMRETNGYPIRSREYAADGSLAQQTLLKSSNHDEIDPAFFAPPEGYTEQRMESPGDAAFP